MADSSSTDFHRAHNNMGKCKDAANFREWGGGMCQAIHVPSSMGHLALKQRTNVRIGKGQHQSIFRPVLHDRRIRAHHRSGAREQGAGLRGRRGCRLERPEGAFRRQQERILSCMPKETSMKPGGDPVDFIASMHDLRLKLDDIWKKSSTTRTQMCCTGLTRQSSSS